MTSGNDSATSGTTRTSVNYAQGFLDALEATSWTCMDCGNTYEPLLTECPNRMLDEAKAALRGAQYRSA